MAKPGNGSARKSEEANKETNGPAAATPGTKRKRRQDPDDRSAIPDERIQGITRQQDETPLKRVRLKSPELKMTTAAQNGGDVQNESGDDDLSSTIADREMEDHKDAKRTDNGKREAQSSAVAVATVASANRSRNANQKPHPAPQPTRERLQLRVPAHQTPGKHLSRPLPTSNNIRQASEISVPTRKLVWGNTPISASSDPNAAPNANAAGFDSPQPPAPPQAFNGTSNAPVAQQQRPPQIPSGRTDPLASTWVWFALLCMLSLAYGPLHRLALLPSTLPPFSVAKVADVCLDRYKRYYYQYYPPPPREVINQTRVQEIEQYERERREQQQQKRKLLKDIESVQKAMEREIVAMEKNAVDMKKEVKEIEDRVKGHSDPVLKVHDRISRINELLKKRTGGSLDDIIEALPAIKKALSEADRNKVLDLSSLDLWEIPEMPEECLGEDEEEDEEDDEDEDEENVSDEDEDEEKDDEEDDPAIAGEGNRGVAEVAVPIIDEDRLEEWSEELQNLIDKSTNMILKDDEIADEIRQWIRSEIKGVLKWDKVVSAFTIENLASQIDKKEKKEDAGNGKAKRGSSSLQADAILAQISERIELEIADQTGRFDFASIRNGAVVVREGPRATSRSLVQSLPYFNRLMAHVGIRFYGYGAEAALSPTDPPGALGQCWAFMGEEALKKRQKSRAPQDFSRGSVATLTVRLAGPTFVHSVVIEHPPMEITDRLDSAIRVFRVVGYEDKVGGKGSYELGRFTYKPDDGPRVEFDVARKLSRRDVPKLRSIVLAVEST